jgi:hypothetical protein
MRKVAMNGRLAFGFTLLSLACSLWLVTVGIAAAVVAMVFTALVGGALHRRCSTGSHFATFASSTMAGLFFAYAAGGAVYIDPFYLPAAAALVVAVLLTPEPELPWKRPLTRRG